MKSFSFSFAILLIASSVTSLAADRSAKPDICKSTRAAVLKQADKRLLLPDIQLNEKESEAATTERACVKSYGIGYPGGVEGLTQGSASEMKADLNGLTTLLFTAKDRSISAGQWDALALEIMAQKGADNQTLNKRNRETIRIKYIQDGMDREQMLLWGHHLYLRKLYQEGSYQKLMQEAMSLRGQFPMEVAAHRWDDYERHTYFTEQSLKNMIAILEFRARAQLAKGDAKRGKILLEEFIKLRPLLVPAFESSGGDPTAEIRAPYCAAKK